MQSEVNFSTIVGETFALFRDAGVYILLFVLVLTGLAVGGQLGGAIDPDRWFGLGIHIDPDKSTAWGILAALVSIVASIVGSYLLLARMLELRGRLAPGGTQIWAYLGLSILTGLGTMLGFVALIFPGVLFMVRWSAAPGYLVGERTGVMAAMEKSWHATKPHSWSIFFAMLAGLVAILLIAAALGVSSVSLDGENLALVVGEQLFEAFWSAVSLAFGAAVFLLVSHEGHDVETVFA